MQRRLKDAFNRRTLLTIAVSVACVLEFWQFHRVARLQSICAAADQVLFSVSEMESGQRGFLLTSNSDYLDTYRFQSKLLEFRMNRLCILLPHSLENKDICDDLRTLVPLKVTWMYLTITTYKSGDVAGAIALVRSDKGLRYKRDITKRLEFIKSAYCPYWLLFPV